MRNKRFVKNVYLLDQLTSTEQKLFITSSRTKGIGMYIDMCIIMYMCMFKNPEHAQRTFLWRTEDGKASTIQALEEV